MYLGPAAWRPYNEKLLDGFNFEKGGGLVGGGVLEWGSHCVDLCQWAVGNDRWAPVEYNPPKDGQIVNRYPNGVELVFREKDWIPLGSCPVRFEGETGWVETGDSGKIVLSSPELLAGRTIPVVEGYPATFHVRDFLDSVKVAESAQRERRHGLLRAHRVPRDERRTLPRPAIEVRPHEKRVHQRRRGESPPLRVTARTVANLKSSLARDRHSSRPIPQPHPAAKRDKSGPIKHPENSRATNSTSSRFLSCFSSWPVVGVTFADWQMDGGRAPSPKKEKDLIAVLHSDAPKAKKADACKDLAVYGSPRPPSPNSPSC